MNRTVATAFALSIFYLSTIGAVERPFMVKSVSATTCGLALSIIPSNGTFRVGSSYDVLMRVNNHTTLTILLNMPSLWLFHLKLVDSSGHDVDLQTGIESTNFSPFPFDIPAGSSEDFHVDLNQYYNKLTPGIYSFSATARMEEPRTVGSSFGLIQTDCVFLGLTPKISVQ